MYYVLDEMATDSDIFRSRLDAELTDRIYSRVPALIRDADNASNPWTISFHTRIWHMAEDSEQFRTSPDPGCVPLFEAKMLHQYDHRWCTYNGEETRELTVGEKADPNFEPNPRYWVLMYKRGARFSSAALDRHRFTSEHGLVEENRSVDDLYVCGYHRAERQLDEVSWHHLRGRNDFPCAIPLN
jgi:hypothetical protein